jgi:serralysin
VKAQVFAANGTRLGSELLVNTATASEQAQPQITALANGAFVVTWVDFSQGVGGATGDSSNFAVKAQVFLADGTRAGSELLVNTATANQQSDQQITALANGGFVVTWEDNSFGVGGATGDSSSTAVKAQVFAVDIPIVGDGGNNTLTSTRADETIDGLGGDDTAVFSGNLSSYTLQDLGNKITISGPDGSDTLFSIEHLQFADGTIHANDGSALFDTIFYLRNNLDVFHAGVNALSHFNTFGFREGRDPNPFFDTSGYLAVNRDVAAAGVNPLDHYHSFGFKEGRDPSLSFDTTLYLLRNPDVAAAGVDPLEHFLRFGFAEGRQTYAAIGTAANGFDAQFYLFHNPDVAAAGVDPLTHFNTHGFHEGRNPNAYFDTAGYLSHYTDVAAAGINPLAHYLASGAAEGRDPSAGFDTTDYLAANPDVAAAGVNPLQHFLQFGIYEGRSPQADGLWG